MPRYFFHRAGDVQDTDHEGVELPSLGEARQEAALFAVDTLKDGRYALWQGGAFRIEVSDSAQTKLFLIAISTTQYAAPQNDVRAAPLDDT